MKHLYKFVYFTDKNEIEIHSNTKINTKLILKYTFRMAVVLIKSIEELDARHESENKFLEQKIKHLQASVLPENKKKIKNQVKKERESLKKKHEDERAKLLFSDDDQIELEKLDLDFEQISLENTR